MQSLAITENASAIVMSSPTATVPGLVDLVELAGGEREAALRLAKDADADRHLTGDVPRNPEQLPGLAAQQLQFQLADRSGPLARLDLALRRDRPGWRSCPASMRQLVRRTSVRTTGAELSELARPRQGFERQAVEFGEVRLDRIRPGIPTPRG